MVTRQLLHHQALRPCLTQEQAGRANRLVFLLFRKGHPQQGLPHTSYWPELNHMISNNCKKTTEISLEAHCQQEQKNQGSVHRKMRRVFGDRSPTGLLWGLGPNLHGFSKRMISQGQWLILSLSTGLVYLPERHYLSNQKLP